MTRGVGGNWCDQWGTVTTDFQWHGMHFFHRPAKSTAVYVFVAFFWSLANYVLFTQWFTCRLCCYSWFFIVIHPHQTSLPSRAPYWNAQKRIGKPHISQIFFRSWNFFQNGDRVKSFFLPLLQTSPHFAQNGFSFWSFSFWFCQTSGSRFLTVSRTDIPGELQILQYHCVSLCIIWLCLEYWGQDHVLLDEVHGYWNLEFINDFPWTWVSWWHWLLLCTTSTCIAADWHLPDQIIWAAARVYIHAQQTFFFLGMHWEGKVFMPWVVTLMVCSFWLVLLWEVLSQEFSAKCFQLEVLSQDFKPGVCSKEFYPDGWYSNVGSQSLVLRCWFQVLVLQCW